MVLSAGLIVPALGSCFALPRCRNQIFALATLFADWHKPNPSGALYK